MLFTRREEWRLFSSLETLVQKANVPLKLIPRLVVKELVDLLTRLMSDFLFDVAHPGHSLFRRPLVGPSPTPPLGGLDGSCRTQ